MFSLFAHQNLMMLQPFATQVVQLEHQRYIGSFKIIADGSK